MPDGGNRAGGDRVPAPGHPGPGRRLFSPAGPDPEDPGPLAEGSDPAAAGIRFRVLRGAGAGSPLLPDGARAEGAPL